MTLIEQVKNAGVVGAGGAGFPTHVKLQGTAEYIILNGAECEPLLRVDQQLMEMYPEKIIKGLYIAGQQVQAKEAIIGIKKKHVEVIDILREKIKELNLDDKVSVKLLPDIYPAGDEQVLVYELTGRVVPEQGIPIAVGCVVTNTETALNIYNASMDLPVTMKYVTVAGDVPKPLTVCVPIGTPLKTLFKMAGRENLTGYKVIDGGPMMGPLLKDEKDYVTKKTKGLVILPENHGLITKKEKKMDSAKKINKSACEQCRMCTDMCPRYLLGHSTSPHKMVRAMAFSVDAGELTTVAQLCCQCNLCEYFSCPAGINPKMANLFYMDELKKKNVKYEKTKTEFTPRKMREYRLVPSKRLIAHLGISKYDKAAPFDDKDSFMPDIVGIHLNSHVGAPAAPVVKPGDKVEKGQLIGTIHEGVLGANVHASVSGIVEAVEDNVVIIVRRETNE